jgi:hypothetical protein
VKLFDTPGNDSYISTLKLSGGNVRMVVVDYRDVRNNNLKPRFLLNKPVTNAETVAIPPLPSKEGAVLFLVNDGAKPIDLHIVIYRVGERPPEALSLFKRWIQIPVKVLSTMYVVPTFTITVKPCRAINAYSNPNIVVCTELLADLNSKDLNDALFPILLHEMAHSLMYLWKLPGYNNEDIADEFAAVYLVKELPHAIKAYIKWLESKDSVTEAVMQIVNGDRHTISIQRARNLKATFANPDELMARWGRLLAPFSRR